MSIPEPEPEPELTDTLRCPACVGHLRPVPDVDQGSLVCSKCGEEFPVIRSIPRLLLSPFREALLGNGTAAEQMNGSCRLL
jgi:uncharacterized protein YbaR (Trm112 family)